MPHHRAVARVVAAAARRVEVDRAAVVERVAGAGDAVVDRHAELRCDGGVARGNRQHQIAHAVGRDVAVHFGQVVLVARRVVQERAGGTIRHTLRRDGEQAGLVVDHREVLAAHGRCDRLRGRAAVGVDDLAGRVGVVGGAADGGLGVGHGHGGGGGARRCLGARRGDRVDLRGGGALIDHALLEQHGARVGVDHELHLLVGGRVAQVRGRHELDAELGLGVVRINARPHHVAWRGDFRRVFELAHGVAAVGTHFQIGRAQVAVGHAGRETAQVLQRAACQHHREVALVADQAPHVAAEHRHATHLLAPVHSREIGAIFERATERKDVCAVLERAHRHQLREGNAPQLAPLLHEGRHALVRRVAPRELATPHATQVRAVLQKCTARESLLESLADRKRVNTTVVGCCATKTALVGCNAGEGGCSQGERSDQNGSGDVAHLSGFLG